MKNIFIYGFIMMLLMSIGYAACVDLDNVTSVATEPGITGNMASGFTVNSTITLCTDTYTIEGVNALNLVTTNYSVDCNGSTLSGNSTTAGTSGIYTSGGDYINISNCIINGYEFGINLKYGATNNYVTNNIVSNTTDGISIRYTSNNNVLINNSVNNNAGEGIIFSDSSSYCILINTTVNGSGGHGIYLDSNSRDINFTNTRSCNNNQLGGVYYDFSDESGLRDNYNSSTYDTSNPDNTIYFDQFESCAGPPYSGCVDLSNSSTYQIKVTGNMTSGFTVIDSITLCTDTYLINVTALTVDADNIVIDCNGSTLQGNGVGSNDGIYNDGNEYVNITNCIISGYTDGINFIWSGEHNILTNNIINNNTEYGINFEYLNMYNILINNTINNNGYYGVSLRYTSDNNTFINNTINYNGYSGVYFAYSSKNNIFVNTIIDENGRNGIQTGSSSETGNNFTNTRACNNNQLGASHYDFYDMTSLGNIYSSSIYDDSSPDNTTYFDWIGGCVESTCDDGLDNDGDGDIDCADLDCLADSACVSSSSSNNDDDDSSAGCRWDSDCSDDEFCNNDDECEELDCDDCEYVEDHKCLAYKCCSDDDCSADEECNDNVCEKIEVEDDADSDDEDTGDDDADTNTGNDANGTNDGLNDDEPECEYECCSDDDCEYSCDDNVCVTPEIIVEGDVEVPDVELIETGSDGQGGYVLVEVTPGSAPVKFYVGQTNEVDLDGDGETDVELTLNSIEGSINFSVESYSEGNSVITTPPIGPNDDEMIIDEPTQDYTWIILLILIVIIIIIIIGGIVVLWDVDELMMLGKKKKKK